MYYDFVIRFLSTFEPPTVVRKFNCFAKLEHQRFFLMEIVIVVSVVVGIVGIVEVVGVFIFFSMIFSMVYTTDGIFVTLL